MATRSSVPADVEADSIIDLVEDCRQISGALGGARLPLRASDTRGAAPVDISPQAVRSLSGYDDYGS